MRRIDRAYRIHERMRKVYDLHEGDDRWDAYYKGTPVKIVGCEILHFNGTNKDGHHLLTNGRFYIKNENHKLLEEEKGLYLFCLYREINGLLLFVDDRFVPVRYISSLIGKGKNTKIGWERIFDLPSQKV